VCGIAGFAGRGDAVDLGRMLRELVHRGPDAQGVWSDPQQGVWLGHRRLSILDLESGDQPMWTADDELGVTFNGEIYNHVELRAELEARGHRFRSAHSDTEVLLHGYREWGSALVSRLNGMWAFALLDRKRRRLLLSRDRFGEKPLYFAAQPGVFAFASELRALTAHRAVRAERSREALAKYFAYGFIPAPLTLFAGAHALPAGCNLVVDLSDLAPRVERWWALRLEPEPAASFREDEAALALREALQRSVARRLRSDVPVGVFLSGGIDSSAVAACAVKALGGAALRTFSIAFDDPSFDESPHARRVAAHLGTQHHEARATLLAARELLPLLADRLDAPIADSSLLPTALLCREARREVKVALGGDGADELFAGYDPFRALRAAQAFARLVPRRIHPALRLLAARLPTSHRYMSTAFRVQRALRGLAWPPALWNPVWLGPCEPAELEALLDAPVDVEQVYSEAIEAWDAAPGWSARSTSTRACTSRPTSFRSSTAPACCSAWRRARRSSTWRWWISRGACPRRRSSPAARPSGCCGARCAGCSPTRRCPGASRASPCRSGAGWPRACSTRPARRRRPAPPRRSGRRARRSTAPSAPITACTCSRSGSWIGWTAATWRRACSGRRTRRRRRCEKPSIPPPASASHGIATAS
jgi:asparagine synthase (glutamine-hydrolysing)